MRNILLFIVCVAGVISCGLTSRDRSVIVVSVYPDSIINEFSHSPVGINLNFLMDGGRYEAPKVTIDSALKAMGVKYLRYPGGEKSDFYFFSQPPYEKSNPSLNRTAGLDNWPGMFNEGELAYDPLDFDEYISLCRHVGAEPVVVVAADRYLDNPEKGTKISSRQELLEHAVEWVKYANIKKKYNVRYWMIGNESWNKNNENSNADIYAKDVIDFSKAMKAVDSSILIIPNGDSEDFFKTVIQKAGDYIDRLCVSNYGVSDFNVGYKSYEDTARCLIWPAQTALNAMNKYATPEQLDKLKLIVAEYGTIDWARSWAGRNDMGHAIVCFDMTGQLLKKKQIEFSCFWNTRWVTNGKTIADHDALDSEGNLTPTGYSLFIWNNFLGNSVVQTCSDEQSVISYASVSLKDRILFIYLLNKGGEMKKVDIRIPDMPGMIQQAWEYYGKDDTDMSPIWQEKKLSRKNFIELKGYSITVVKYKL